MADYDVGVVGLTTPAASAPLAQCRPVVSVRNNGIHDAVASGYVRIYSAGLLIFESEVYSDTIGPGETRPASAVHYWTPPAEGIYTVQGYVTTPLDQVEPNNNLYPTAVTISGVEPPPPTPVPLHASQHESGGTDELSLEDLPGRAADQQRPINHASNHELSGIDPVNVTGMSGILAEAQTPKAHAASHKTGGADAVSVLELPDVTDLELLAHKGEDNGYAALDSDGLVPKDQLALLPNETPPDNYALTYGNHFNPAAPDLHADTHDLGATDPIHAALVELDVNQSVTILPVDGNVQVIRVDVSPDQLAFESIVDAHLAGEIICAAGPAQSVIISLRFHSTDFTENVAIATLSPASGCTYRFLADLSGGIQKSPNFCAVGINHSLMHIPAIANSDVHAIASLPVGVLIQDTRDWYWEIRIDWVAGVVGSSVVVENSNAHVALNS